MWDYFKELIAATWRIFRQPITMPFVREYLPLFLFIVLLLWKFIFISHCKINFPPGIYIAVLGCMVVLMTIWRPRGKWGKAFWLLVIFIFTGFEIQSIYKDREEYDKQHADLVKMESNNFKDIFAQFNALIDRQEKLFDRQEKLSTGGDSFCWVDAIFMGNNTWMPMFTHKGKYPLYGIHARIADINKMNKIIPHNLEEFMQTNILVNVGDLSEQLGNFRYEMPIMISDEKRQGYNIFYDARNGLWMQKLRFANVNGVWLKATKVYRRESVKNKLIDKLIFEKVSHNFPKDVDWN